MLERSSETRFQCARDPTRLSPESNEIVLKEYAVRSSTALFASAALLCAIALSTGCTTTKQQKPELDAQMSGFLGDAYPLLKPGTEGQVALRYVNESVDWKQYKAGLLEPVQFWAGSDSKLAPDAQQMLSSYLYNALKMNLDKQGFKLTDKPSAGVIRIQIAITDVTKATPVLRTVSVLIPQARLLNQAQELLTGSYGFSGSAEVALKATDAHTGQLLAAGIDRRSGGGSVEQAAVWQWGDAQAAIDFWAQRFAERLAELRAKAKAKAK
jgi:hypothetical protein